MTPDQILTAAGATFKAKAKEYGDNYIYVGNALQALFPHGMSLKTAADQNRFSLFNLILVKLSRYAVNWDKGGHQDSIHDAVVYCAMLESLDAGLSEAKASASNAGERRKK